MKKSVSLTKKSLSLKESIIIGSMLFGMFFGAGNLIFPVHMGQLAGSNVWPAIIGFIVTGVGLPLLGVASLGISKKNSLFELSSLVGDNYKYFFTILLYLTIGPFFAIPRCATTSFTIGIAPLLGGASEVVPRFIFTLIFFSIVLFLAINPNKIMTFIGQYINPIFLVFLSILIIVSFFNPIKQVNPIISQGDYSSMPFFKGFLEGYNTMDAIASLAFGITVITVIRNLGIKNENAIAFNIIKAGLIGCGLMAIIYILTTLMGTMSIGTYEVTQNG
ncbi:MAG: branched-chain amino acid transport system II carrier protein, partial [Lachnospiraceae bacterium]|nr:branched-chain amino acid transport system II carrier protein [Lachnospiraceae bacterium]